MSPLPIALRIRWRRPWSQGDFESVQATSSQINQSGLKVPALQSPPSATFSNNRASSSPLVQASINNVLSALQQQQSIVFLFGV
ncbi:MAG: hypothetical protein EZS28_033448 [Streblomastix strix]|uniref:Uncharacterized protein n=1 Tax=Streblomastix strix TaxID=222440 RepID=A0A5J4UMP5_9EUKA|nr:MAG: hypothetical protein EZS28_033448 [Streblomastix strix]